MKAEVIQGDCLEAMWDIPDGSIDACITDIPYGTTACAWDVVIPFAPMWAALKRVVKRNGAIVLFGQQPFTSALVMSNPAMFRYQWVWKKNRTTGHANANKMPMKNTEDLAVFYQELPTFNPQGLQPCVIDQRRASKTYAGLRNINMQGGIQTLTGYPKTLIEDFSAEFLTVHPTQKPVELLRYLVRTYTQEGDTVLDFTCGSGTTGVACMIEQRNFIGIEQDEHYAEVSRARIKRASGVACDIPRRIKTEKELPLFAVA